MLGRINTFWQRPQVHVAALLALACALFVPYAVAGPGFFIDDWWTLANGALDGWWMSAGSAQWGARPGASAVYAVTFGLIGERPLIHFGLAAVVVTSVALILYRVAARFLYRRISLGVAALWLVLPTHTSLEMWPSCLNIALALLLLLLGAEQLTASPSSLRRDVRAGLAFGIGTLCYEAVAPAAGVIAFAVALGRPRGSRMQAIVPSALSLAAAGGWMLLNWHPEKEGLGVTMDPWSILPGHFGVTLTGDARWAELIVIVVVLVTSTLVFVDVVVSERRSSIDWRHGLVAAGWLTIALGSLPFISYFYSPLGMGDRVLVVSSIGGAMVLVAAGSYARKAHPAVAAAFLVMVVGVAVGQRISMATDYAVAADDGRRIRGFVEQQWPEPPRERLLFGPEPIERRNIVAFYDVGAAMQLLYNDRAVRAEMAFDPDDFVAAEDQWRVDIRPLSRLDDGELGPQPFPVPRS